MQAENRRTVIATPVNARVLMQIRIRTHDKDLKDTELYDPLGSYLHNCQYNQGLIYGFESGIQRLIRIRVFIVMPVTEGEQMEFFEGLISLLFLSGEIPADLKYAAPVFSLGAGFMGLLVIIHKLGRQ